MGRRHVRGRHGDDAARLLMLKPATLAQDQLPKLTRGPGRENYCFPSPPIRACRSLSALSTTEIDDALIAKAANIGLIRIPNQG